jgi:hypothetical protein
MKYEVKFWQKLLQKLEQALPIQFIHTPASSFLSHPWQITTVYDKKKKQWLASFLTGLVSGLPAYISMIFEDAPAIAQQRIRLERKEKGIVPIEPSPKASVSVYLDEGAQVSCTRFQEIKKGAPAFFQKLGVTDPVKNRAGEEEDTATRLLKSCDMVLVQPRPSLTNKVDYAIFGVGVRITSTPGLFVPTNREPFVNSIPIFIETKQPPSFRSVFFNTFVDTGRDELYLSRLFLLSPVLPLLDPEDLSVWVPFYQYNCHHNVVHATQQIARAKTNYEDPLVIQTALAGGTADAVYNQLLTSGLNVDTSVLQYLNQRDLSGRFYSV